MYMPPFFEETRVDVLHDLIRERPFATVVTRSAAGLEANHIPLMLVPEPLPYGTLRGHVARANAMWSDTVPGSEALCVFHGPDSYISPSWYATKQESGRVVPTWNYAVVHAYGPLQPFDDPARLRELLEALVARHERRFAAPWSIADAPGDFIAKMIGGIVGVEVPITRLIGKWKVSQNQPPQNVPGIVQRLRADDPPNPEMADLVTERAPKPS